MEVPRIIEMGIKLNKLGSSNWNKEQSFWWGSPRLRYVSTRVGRHLGAFKVQQAISLPLMLINLGNKSSTTNKSRHNIEKSHRMNSKAFVVRLKSELLEIKNKNWKRKRKFKHKRIIHKLWLRLWKPKYKDVKMLNLNGNDK